MRQAAGLLVVISALSIAIALGATPANAASPTCYYLSASVPGGFFDTESSWAPGLAFQYISWPGGAQSPLTQVTTRVYSTSWGMLAASWVEYSIPGVGVEITIGNASPIGGTAYYWVCFS